ncbi:hypothetical protein CH54_3149 [Yersinia rochesterensis]|uniref:Uncharacterized protein n=1 Tax=Yersinia rochesterensis TaxID=1604335 RepID=A0A8D4N7L8_9GAMM|nr:hypothetical protein DJ57_3966 [Yersinia rochesterensis]AJI88457.1 hypothetical protein AW19_2639 [Yersinia frederiksenii Y225]AJJ36212.1 hypothetical protein CH54_3149 [Yersinia rochesterensis]AYD45267.1 hypothetical protein DXZ79_17170 [Yersinia rochesterensis]CRY64741.1 Uncharacterised protein [Yersinia kristensenii]
MRLLIIGTIILFTKVGYAELTIKPIDSDRSFCLMRDNQSKINIIITSKNDSVNIKNRACNYSINDYRRVKNHEVGCAVNINRKKSSISGDICN